MIQDAARLDEGREVGDPEADGSMEEFEVHLREKQEMGWLVA